VEENKNEEYENEDNTAKGWFQENLRIIISIVIVVAIAGGIYSYSKRSQAPISTTGTEEEQMADQGSVSGETAVGEEGVIGQQGATEEGTKENVVPQKNEQVAPTGTSQETEGSFIETAGKGDGTTVLARRALANYLEKNPDSELTPEHKIYIEDYLRKHVGFKGKVFVGTSVEFSKGLVQEAITKSKTLNDSQLKNLHKYSVRVPSLS
jgi:hypothetical protein